MLSNIEDPHFHALRTMAQDFASYSDTSDLVELPRRNKLTALTNGNSQHEVKRSSIPTRASPPLPLMINVELWC